MRLFCLLLTFFVVSCSPNIDSNSSVDSTRSPEAADIDTPPAQPEQPVTPPSDSEDSNEVLPTSKYNIGFIGESHSSGAFGDTLSKEMTTIGDVRRFAVGGSSTQFWLRPSPFEFKWGYILDEYEHNSTKAIDSEKGTKVFLSKKITKEFFEVNQFNMVIIQLMDNQLNNSVANNLGSVMELIELVYESTLNPPLCFYVSATHKDRSGSYPSVTNQKKRKFIDSVLKPALKDTPCKLIDSMDIVKLSEINTPDGIHLDKTTGALWGRKAAQAIKAMIP